MKIAWLTNAGPQTGVGYYAWHLRQALQTADPTLQIDEYLFDGQQGRLMLHDQVLGSVKPWPGPLGAKTWQWIRLGKIWTQITKDKKYNVYHATNQSLSFLVQAEQPWVVTVHDIIERQAPQSVMGGLSARYLYKGLTAASQIIAVSEFSAAALQKFYSVPPSKVTVIGNGVTKPFGPGVAGHTSGRPPQILFVGSHHPRKNVHVAEHVVSNLQADYPGATLIKIDGSQNLTEDELADAYQAADVLLFPSLFEGFGLPVLQAMACGLPVVASTATSIPEVAGSAALLCDPDDIAAFTQATMRILQDAELRQNLREEGFRQAAKFTWSAAARATLDVYKKVLL